MPSTKKTLMRERDGSVTWLQRSKSYLQKKEPAKSQTERNEAKGLGMQPTQSPGNQNEGLGMLPTQSNPILR